MGWNYNKTLTGYKKWKNQKQKIEITVLDLRRRKKMVDRIRNRGVQGRIVNLRVPRKPKTATVG